MLYRRTPELPALRLIQNGNLGDAIYPDEATQTVTSAGEFFLKSLWLEASLTKDENCQLPAVGPDNCRTIVSRKYNADMAFKNSLNEISVIFADIDRLSSYSIEAEFISSTNAETTAITSENIAADNGNITYLSSNEISTDNLSAGNGLVHNISGDNLEYDNSDISNLRSNNIHTSSIIATGVAFLSAAATFWADLAEMYKSDIELHPGMLVRFNGSDEIEIARDGVANGVISKRPALLMNSSLKDRNKSAPVIMVGRSPVLIKDKIDKFDRIELSNVPGVAQRAEPGSKRKILGISLESKPDRAIHPVECVVKLAI